MKILVFIVTYPIIWILAKLPFGVIYFLSDIICFILYNILRYRRKVVYKNLELAFPNKSHAEISRIAKLHYQHLTDLFLEMLKTWNMSSKELNKRFKYNNVNNLNELYAKNKSVVLVCGHYGNWEWLGNMENFIKYKGHAIYKGIKNRYFDKLIYKIRAKFGATPIDKDQIVRSFITNQKAGILGLYLMVSDQSPKLEYSKYWTSFLGIKVPVFVGSEILAKKLNTAVVFLKIKKVKRGYYEASFKLLEEHPKEIPNYKITDRFLKELENQIRDRPEYYFWTHKRFKHANIKTY